MHASCSSVARAGVCAEEGVLVGVALCERAVCVERRVPGEVMRGCVMDSRAGFRGLAQGEQALSLCFLGRK